MKLQENKCRDSKNNQSKGLMNIFPKILEKRRQEENRQYW